MLSPGAGGGVPQVVKHLPNKHEAQSSKPQECKTKKKETYLYVYMHTHMYVLKEVLSINKKVLKGKKVF
jgi:hypothetical protein